MPRVPADAQRRPTAAVGEGRAGVEYHVGLKELPAAVRPRERLLHRGAQDLSDAELLAIIVRTGTPSCNALELSTRALARHGGLAGVDRAALDELCKDE